MKKYLISFFTICFALNLTCCGNSPESSPSSDETGLLSSEMNNDSEVADIEDVPEYYIEDNVLYINKIHYSVMYLTGQNQYLYETPWEKEWDKFTKIDVNAALVCDSDESMAGKDYVNHSGIFYDLDNITEANVILDMQGVRDASFLLAECKNLVSAKVTINAASLDAAGYMFTDDENLNDADVWFERDQPEIVKRMFYNCPSLASGHTNLSKIVTDCTEMYYGCSSLTGAEVLFKIEEDTKFAMMFAECNSLASVNIPNVHVTKGGQSIFNNVNSIDSYSFADSWIVDTDNLAEPVGDSFHDVIIVPLGKGDMMLEFNIYSKSRPGWYKSYVETVHDLDDWYCISESRALDVYINKPSEYSDIDTQDVLDAVDDALAQLAEKNLDGEYKKAAEELKGNKDRASDLVDVIESIH